jgi:hypothetical protein
MNTLDPSQPSHRANFLPHLPSISAEPQGIDLFPEALEREYADYLPTSAPIAAFLSLVAGGRCERFLITLQLPHILSSSARTGDVI